MEKETCTSRPVLTAMLTQVARKVKETCGISIWFVEGLGRRWSFIAGEQDDISFLPTERIELTERYGVMSRQWAEMPAEKRNKLMMSLQAAVELYG